MAISTSWRREPPRGIQVERELDGGSVAFARHAYPHWVEELAVAVERGDAFAARTDDGDTVGFCCHSVNRRGWIGPMATDPERGRVGVGSATLSATLADLEAHGVALGEIAWVSNLRFYGKCTARVSRVFRAGRRHLA
jgi:GNAT superfamily N-acetyltransferase